MKFLLPVHCVLNVFRLTHRVSSDRLSRSLRWICNTPNYSSLTQRLKSDIFGVLQIVLDWSYTLRNADNDSNFKSLDERAGWRDVISRNIVVLSSIVELKGDVKAHL